MRRLLYTMNVSLDGYVAAPDGSLGWAIVDEELHRFFNDQARAMDAFLYGRRMYALMSDYWPTADSIPSTPDYMIEYAQIWREKPKVVFSRTLEAVDWNSRLVTGDLGEEITRLKTEPGRDLAISGPTIAARCIQLGLVDEYGLTVHPVILGAGVPFFPALETTTSLDLAETRTFRSGVVHLRYLRAASPA